MIQREIEQCIAGLVSLMPDENARRTACECTADAMQADRTFGGVRDEAYEEAYLKKVQACGGPGVGSSDDPFAILPDDAVPSDLESPVDDASFAEPQGELGAAEASSDWGSE